MTKQQLEAQLDALVEENKALKTKAANGNGISYKVSAKGCVSVYGLNRRFPVSLYAQQWLKLSDHMEDIETFIKEHKGDLAWK